MRIPYYQVDAFTSEVFGGNPAGVCLLDQWLPDNTLQQIAAENNLSETSFLVQGDEQWELRWFTPTVEVDLCGHATLAAAFVIFQERRYPKDSIYFSTRSGLLSASRAPQGIELDFPSRPAQPCTPPPSLTAGLGRRPVEVLRSRDYLAVFENAEQVLDLRPNFEQLALLDTLGIIATAPGRPGECDFVSRFFAPRAGILEDPVTGSAHSTLIPFWASRLGKKELIAHQLSKRRGHLHCRALGERVGIAGKAVVYSRGEIQIP